MDSTEKLPLTKKQEEIRQMLISSINNFNLNEKYLIENNLCERCICSKFAMYVENTLHHSPFEEYTTDVEYDRGMYGNNREKNSYMAKLTAYI